MASVESVGRSAANAEVFQSLIVVSSAHLPVNPLYKPPISRLVNSLFSFFFSPRVQSPFHLESRLYFFLQFTSRPADVFLDLVVLSDPGGGSRQLYNVESDGFPLKR